MSEKANKGGDGHQRGENGWGGRGGAEVWSEEGRARALANLRPQPDPLANSVHGMSSYLGRAIAPPCRFCIAKEECEAFSDAPRATCTLAEAYQAQVQADIMALPHIEPQDRPIVQEYAKMTTAIAIMDLYLAHASPFLPGADKAKYVDTQPVLKERTKLGAALLKYAAELGLTPMARHRLKSSTDGKGAGATLAAALTELARQEAEGRKAGAVDGEFDEAGP
ncbi:MAG: hypothetical protein WCP21_06005 [Armatimonadota bacterium]